MTRLFQSPVAETGLVYDLRLSDRSSERFYAEIAAFSDRVLSKISRRAAQTLSAYALHTRIQCDEQPRSMGEYAIELLMLGMLQDRYMTAAESTPSITMAAAHLLFRLRRWSPRLKPLVDRLRSRLLRVFFMPGLARHPNPGPASLPKLSRLIDWVKATGDFEQEALRLAQWQSYLRTLSMDASAATLQTIQNLFHWFKREAEIALGVYTRGVAGFLAGPYAHRGCREDQLFCGRRPVEYHLNMVAAEILNRGLRDGFAPTPRRAVLVPTCMRGAKASTCRARASGADLVCAACDPDCTVNRITRQMGRLGARVYLIPHSTGFSHWLERWQCRPGFGVVAIACLSNILPGGFEMRARGIASQCVPLDFPGCAKHWSEPGVSTSLNQNRLAQLVQIKPCTAPSQGTL